MNSLGKLFSGTKNLGFSYKAVDQKSTNIINATEGLIRAVQQIGCQELIPNIIYRIEHMPPSPYDNQSMTTNEMITMLITQHDKIINEFKNSPMGVHISHTAINDLKEALNNLIKTSIFSASVNGVVDEAEAKKIMINTLKSFCPGSMLGVLNQPVKNMFPELELSTRPVELMINNGVRVGNVVLGKYKFTGHVVVDIDYDIDFSNDPKASIGILCYTERNGRINLGVIHADRDNNGMKVKGKIHLREISFDGKYVICIEQHVVNDNTGPIINNLHVVITPGKGGVSTTGSVSKFGQTCNSWVWIMILIIVLVVVAYIYYINKDTIKLPTLSQRISQFGRHIKTLRKF